MRIAEKDHSHDSEKHGDVTGSALTTEVLDSAPEILKRTRFTGKDGEAKLVGLQQYFTPLEIARLAAAVIGPNTPTLDFTAGRGSMLQSFNENMRYGIEIDAEHAAAAKEANLYLGIQGDAQKAVPMMRAVDMTFPGIAINPPFGLTWMDPVHSKDVNARIPSVKLAFLWSLDLMDSTGQGMMLCDRHDLEKHVLTCEEAKSIYAVVDIEGPVWENVETPVSLVFFVKPTNLGYRIRNLGHGDYMRRFTAPKAHLMPLVDDITRQRDYVADYVYTRGEREYQVSYRVDRFKGLRQEYDRRRTLQEKGRAAITHNLDLKGKKLRFYLNAYARERLAKAGNLRQLELLNGQSVSYFATNTRDWKVAEHAEAEGLVTISDPLKARVAEVMSHAIRTSTPLFPIPPQMRLGWIEDLHSIKCTRDDPTKGFTSGKSYPLRTAYRIHKEKDERVKLNRKTGEADLREYVQERKLLHVMIENNEGESHDFDESSVNIRYLMEYFDLPDPGDVKTRFPELVGRNLELLETIESEIKVNFLAYAKKPPNNIKTEDIEAFAFKHFQKDHMSRLLTKQRGLLAHEQGLGKTLQLLTLAEATIRLDPKCQNKVLFVSPQDLIPQTQRECMKFFGRKMEVIRTAEEAHKVKVRLLSGEEGWFITHFEALSRVGKVFEALPEVALPTPRGTVNTRLAKETKLMRRAKKVVDRYHRMTSHTPKPEDRRRLIRQKMEELRLRTGFDHDSEYSGVNLTAAMHSMGKRPTDARADTRPATSKWACPKCGCDTAHGWTGEVCRREKTSGFFGCGYVHRRKRYKPAYTHLGKCFIDGVVCVDELSEMRGDTSQRSQAIRALARGKHKYGGTGTPLSNFINDTFWGLWFALGDASLAFPYAYRGGRAKFEEDFCVIEHMLGKKGTKKEGQREQKKILARVTNISQFWRLTQPGVSRCRKEHTGEPIVDRVVHPVIVPMGRTQKEIHKFSLDHFSDWFIWAYPDHAMVQHDLVEKFEAGLGQRWWLEKAATLPEDLAQLRDWPELERIHPPGTENEGEEVYPWRHDVSNWTPGTLKVLQLAIEHAEKGEKILIGSDLIGTGHWISERLNEKGVKSVHITDEAADGTIKTQSPAKRAKAVSEFTSGNAQVMTAGVKAVKLGHNMDLAQVVIVHGLPDSYMEIDQFVARVHRLTSKQPVSVYVILPKGSLADTKWQLLKDKGGTSDLAFDGELSANQEEEIDWAQVLKDLKKKGVTFDGDEVDEADVEAAWENITYTAPKPALGQLIVKPIFERKAQEIPRSKLKGEMPKLVAKVVEDNPIPKKEDSGATKKLPTRRGKITSTEVLTVEEHLEDKAKRSPVKDRAKFPEGGLFTVDPNGGYGYEQDSLFG